MCFFVVALISFTRAARVVDLPDPVGPVTITSPFFSFVNRFSCGGIPRSSSETTFSGIKRKAADIPRLWTNIFTLNLAISSISIEKSRSKVCSKDFFCFSSRISRRYSSACFFVRTGWLSISVISPLIRRAGFEPVEIKISDALYLTAVLRILSSLYIVLCLYLFVQLYHKNRFGARGWGWVLEWGGSIRLI